MASTGNTSLVADTRGVHDCEPDTRRSNSRTREAGRVDGSIYHEVRRTLVRTSEGWKEDPLKSEKYIALHPHRANQQASLWPGRNYGGCGEWRGSLDWIKRRQYDSFYCRRFRPAAVKIGQPNLCFYDLRHTGASLFAGSGMPLALVAAAQCHSDTATTHKVHLGFFPDDFASDTERLDAYIGAANYPQPLLRKPVVVANG